MRFFILPRGRAYSAPADRLGRKVADLVLSPTDARERLCHYMYWTLEPSNPFGLLQEALILAQTVEPLEKRIRVEGVKTGTVTALDLPTQIQQAVTAGILTEAEAGLMRDYDRKVMALINVDDFAQHELGTQAEPVPQTSPVRSSAQVA
jgi:acyl-CoA dehydrogenase